METPDTELRNMSIDDLVEEYCSACNDYQDYVNRSDFVNWSEDNEYKAWLYKEKVMQAIINHGGYFVYQDINIFKDNKNPDAKYDGKVSILRFNTEEEATKYIKEMYHDGIAMYQEIHERMPFHTYLSDLSYLDPCGRRCGIVIDTVDADGPDNPIYNVAIHITIFMVDHDELEHGKSYKWNRDKVWKFAFGAKYDKTKEGEVSDDYIVQA